MTYTYSKHYEQAKYCLIDEHTRIPEVQLISRYTWDKLSDEDKAIISECAKESAVYERDIWKNTEEAAVKMIEDKDITVTKVSDEEKQNLREKLQPIYDKYCSNYIDIIKEIEKIRSDYVFKKKIPICIYNKQCGDCSSTCTGNIAFCKRNGHADQYPG